MKSDFGPNLLSGHTQSDTYKQTDRLIFTTTVIL